MKKGFLFLSFILVSFKIFACSDVDVTDQNPFLKELFKNPRNQSYIGWCYAFSAADILSAELGRPVSSMHIGAIHNKFIQNDFLYRFKFNHSRSFVNKEGQIYESGNAYNALNSAIENRFVCSEEEMPYDKKYIGQFEILVQALERLAQEIKVSHHSEAEVKSTIEIILLRHDIQVNLEETYKAIKTENLNLVLEKIIAQQCRQKLEVPKLNVKSTIRKSRFLKNIEYALKIGKPVEISYEAGVVYKNQAGSHSSILFARRWKNNRCEYKVRNSLGRTCKMYNESAECNESEGSYWVSEKVLTSMLKGVTFIEESR